MLDLVSQCEAPGVKGSAERYKAIEIPFGQSQRKNRR